MTKVFKRVKAKIDLIAVAISCALLAGCATNYGSPEVTDIGRYLSLQKGVSTREEVFRIFGQPYVEGSTWIYYKEEQRTSALTYTPFIGMLAGGSDLDITTLRISFDAPGRVKGIETARQAKFASMWAFDTGIIPWGSEQAERRVKAEMIANGLPYDDKLAAKREKEFWH